MNKVNWYKKILYKHLFWCYNDSAIENVKKGQNMRCFLMEEHIYLCIDLKSFYASVECVERGLDPMTTHLVVVTYAGNFCQIRKLKQKMLIS